METAASNSPSKWEFSCNLEVDYGSEEIARIVYTALTVDKELQPDKVKRQMLVSNGKLSVHFEAIEARFLRASYSAFLDVLTLASKTIEEFGQEQTFILGMHFSMKLYLRPGTISLASLHMILLQCDYCVRPPWSSVVKFMEGDNDYSQSTLNERRTHKAEAWYLDAASWARYTKPATWDPFILYVAFPII